MKTNQRPTTIGGWIKMLPEDVRQQALDNIAIDIRGSNSSENSVKAMLEAGANNMDRALRSAFIWHNKPQGFWYWQDIATDKKYVYES